MFQFRRFPSYTYLIQYRIPFGGFPHSEISGSQLICSSPKLIAAYHVLHRLLMPRHSPCALISLTVVGISIRSTPVSVPAFALAENFAPLRCSSSRIKTRLRWAFDSFGVRLRVSRFRCFQTLVNSYRQSIWFSMTVELCRLIKKFSLAKNCTFTLFN